MTIRFVMDETSLGLDGLTPLNGIEVLEQFLDRVDDAALAGKDVLYSSEFFETPILGDLCFWDLCDPTAPIVLPKHLQERAAAAFGPLARWDETGEWPDNFDVSVDGQAVQNLPSVAWAHFRNANPNTELVACISSSTRGYTGLRDVLSGAVSRPIWFIETDRDAELFYRWISSEHSGSPAGMAELALASFKNLNFADGCWTGIRAMTGQYRDLARVIVKHLGTLSDEGQRIFGGSWQQAPAEFGSLGIEISDETGGTKQNGTARQERCIIIAGEERFFWWHTKLEPHQNRIHIWPDEVPGGGKITVGIFCRHLTT
ncbi:hypothetical protein [Rhizobium sp. BT03]|uniref:hypothetical protein n=1 Tax=Rhizobium sp. BT03 TaxID=3045156 RepID=UPI0024B3D482|nr:hypothetical protein [Rhizobium sp. BT03]WHO73919.1 hypothetical protein QMO80_002971 [Rhizobium sp. BT03]